MFSLYPEANMYSYSYKVSYFETLWYSSLAVATVQLKGNLIPARVLQVGNSRVKITSCGQYTNGHPLRSCLCQANHRACAPANVTSILNELVNIYTMNLQILSLYVPIDAWIVRPAEQLLTCSRVQYPMPYCLACHCLMWRKDLVSRLRMDPSSATKSPLTSSRLVNWLEGKKICY